MDQARQATEAAEDRPGARVAWDLLELTMFWVWIRATTLMVVHLTKYFQ